MRKLKDPEEPLDRLLTRARKLGGTFGPLQYQLPPNWSVDIERLHTFLRTLPSAAQAPVDAIRLRTAITGA